MTEYIEREDAIREIQRAAIFNRDAILRDWEVSIFVRSLYGLINRLPAAPVREVVPGHWMWDQGTRTCNQCGQMRATDKRDNFCPNCGADMRREAEQDG